MLVLFLINLRSELRKSFVLLFPTLFFLSLTPKSSAAENLEYFPYVGPKAIAPVMQTPYAGMDVKIALSDQIRVGNSLPGWTLTKRVIDIYTCTDIDPYAESSTVDPVKIVLPKNLAPQLVTFKVWAKKYYDTEKICAFEHLFFENIILNKYTSSVSDITKVAVNSIRVLPSLSPSIIPIPSLRALPSVSPSPSASRVANSNKPSGSTPSVSGTPVVGTRFKVSVKSWNMNGNKFEGRSVYLKLCDDPECKDVVNSYPVIETGTLNFDVAKKLTMPKIVGKEGQYIKVVDSVSYLAPATSESGEDILVELSSSVKRIVKNTNNSPGANPGTSESANLSENDVNENQESTSVESAVVSSEMNQQTNFLPTNLIIAILGILILVLLIVVIMLMKRKNK